MSRKPPELPNIEDATLVACLAPLMGAMHAGSEPGPTRTAETRAEAPIHDRLGSNDNKRQAVGSRDQRPPEDLDAWRSRADDDFGMFRVIERFLSMTDAELDGAAAAFPKQIGATAVRISGLKRRLADQYDRVTIVLAALERAAARVGPVAGED